MQASHWKSLSITLGLLCALAVFLPAAAAPPHLQTEQTAQEVLLSLDPAQTKLHWTVESTLHTVQGSFSVKGGSVHFDPESGKAGGEIVVFATSGDSGNTSRDKKMHKEVLESSQFPDIVFRPTLVEGKVSAAGTSDIKLHGIFLLHGGEHELVVPVHAELNGRQWKGTTKFEVPYIRWGLRDPSSFLLKVKPLVVVELEMAGTLNAASQAAGR